MIKRGNIAIVFTPAIMAVLLNSATCINLATADTATFERAPSLGPYAMANHAGTITKYKLTDVISSDDDKHNRTFTVAFRETIVKLDDKHVNLHLDHIDGVNGYVEITLDVTGGPSDASAMATPVPTTDPYVLAFSNIARRMYLSELFVFYYAPATSGTKVKGYLPVYQEKNLPNKLDLLPVNVSRDGDPDKKHELIAVKTDGADLNPALIWIESLTSNIQIDSDTKLVTDIVAVTRSHNTLTSRISTHLQIVK